MKKYCLIAVVLALLLFLPLPAFAESVPTDGSYQIEVTLSGGSGRANVDSPVRLTVDGGVMTAEIIWSSPNYTYMLVDGTQYDPVNTEGNSTFRIPVAALDAGIAVSAETIAMSTPHLIEYTLFFDSSTLKPVSIAEKTLSAETVGLIVIIIVVIAVLAFFWIRKKRMKNASA